MMHYLTWSVSGVSGTFKQQADGVVTLMKKCAVATIREKSVGRGLEVGGREISDYTELCDKTQK